MGVIKSVVVVVVVVVAVVVVVVVVVAVCQNSKIPLSITLALLKSIE